MNIIEIIKLIIDKYTIRSVSAFLLLSILILAMDYHSGFSDNHLLEDKMEQLGKINKTLKEDCVTIDCKQELLRIEKQIISRQTFWGKVLNVNQNIRSPYLHITSSCWTVILVMLIIPGIVNAKNTIIQVGMVISLQIFCLLFLFLMTFIFVLIPVFKYPIFNYLINFVGSFCLFDILYSLIKVKK